jgi:glycolate oxidase FAD binding subunit
MTDNDISQDLQARVQEAAEAATPLAIRGSGSKHFYGRASNGAALELSAHRGILSYAASELVITARAGTPLAEIEATLAQNQQMLPFEPPHFGNAGTIGGAVACGLAGPRRPWGGAARDSLLGVTLLDGNGRILHFGGQVMKNVAGYDLSRLMAGALGTLGVLLEVSLKVLPLPTSEFTLSKPADSATALRIMQQLQAGPTPLSGACQLDDRLYLRLAASAQSAQRLAREIDAELSADNAFWLRLRDHSLPFFDDQRPLWRLSVAPISDTDIAGDALIDWGGAQRWIKTGAPPQWLRQEAERLGGHATLFRNGERHSEVFHPLPAVVSTLHRRLKQVFDPAGIFNPGRQYAAF